MRFIFFNHVRTILNNINTNNIAKTTFLNPVDIKEICRHNLLEIKFVFYIVEINSPFL